MKEVEETEEGFYSFSSQDSRELSEDDLQKLAKQTIVTDFKRNKLEIEARKNWDKFYHRNRENFFKDRHWSAEDLKIICPDIDFELKVATSVVDLSIPSISSPFEEQVDLATLIFVLSAIHPDKHKVAAENMRNLVK
uniref:Uncharacterized protein n=1 Tax=Caenorhabditis japonica TaxID=281687 RepID=A0A8R1IQE0_CAEJA